MKIRRLIAVTLVSIVAAACADAADTSVTSLSDDTATTGGGVSQTSMAGNSGTEGLDPAAAMTMMQEDMSRLAEEIQSSEAAADLQVRWEQFQVDMTAALTEMQEDGTIDAEVIRDELEQFETDLETLGDQVEPELRAAWDSFRQDLDQLIS
ncbi:MAG TPA: hypothetical protein VIC07_06670 [Acidimicrobiia bacterium]|jgi:hypothetical protein